MVKKVEQAEIGSRLARLRKEQGWAQSELAEKLGVSRSSLAQMELGKRNISIQEMIGLSIELNFSIDAIVSARAPKEYALLQEHSASSVQEEQATAYQEKRISVPKFRISKFKQVFLYILESCAGKPNVGETVLYKLLYFVDFNHYEIYESHLSGATYQKLPDGPVPKRINEVIKMMLGDGEIKRIKTKYYGKPQIRYLPMVKADLQIMKASEMQVIDRVIDQFSDWTAKAIDTYVHLDMPLIVSKEGQDIDYELAFYRETPFSVRVYYEQEDAE